MMISRDRANMVLRASGARAGRGRGVGGSRRSRARPPAAPLRRPCFSTRRRPSHVRKRMRGCLLVLCKRLLAHPEEGQQRAANGRMVEEHGLEAEHLPSCGAPMREVGNLLVTSAAPRRPAHWGPGAAPLAECPWIRARCRTRCRQCVPLPLATLRRACAPKPIRPETVWQ